MQDERRRKKAAEKGRKKERGMLKNEHPTPNHTPKKGLQQIERKRRISEKSYKFLNVKDKNPIQRRRKTIKKIF